MNVSRRSFLSVVAAFFSALRKKPIRADEIVYWHIWKYGLWPTPPEVQIVLNNIQIKRDTSDYESEIRKFSKMMKGAC